MDWEQEIIISSSRSGGAGGQHVNKVSTKISLKWAIASSAYFSEEEKKRLILKLSNYINKEGFLLVHCSETRSQAENKRRALLKLENLVRKALVPTKKRVATKVPKSVVEKRLNDKKRQARKKAERGTKRGLD